MGFECSLDFSLDFFDRFSLLWCSSFWNGLTWLVHNLRLWLDLCGFFSCLLRIDRKNDSWNGTRHYFTWPVLLFLFGSFFRFSIIKHLRDETLEDLAILFDENTLVHLCETNGLIVAESILLVH